MISVSTRPSVEIVGRSSALPGSGGPAKRAVVFGVTGLVGSHVATELLSRGFAVTGVARSKRGFERRDDLTLVRGSLYDPAFVFAVTAECDVIVVAVPAVGRETPRCGPPFENLGSAVPLILAAAENAEARVAVVGGAGGLSLAKSAPVVLYDPALPGAYVEEAVAHADVFAALDSTPAVEDWFYMNPAVPFRDRLGESRISEPLSYEEIRSRNRTGRTVYSVGAFAQRFVDEIVFPQTSRAKVTVGHPRTR